MKILFVNVINESRKRSIERELPGLGTYYLASYLRKYGDFNDIEIVEAGQNFDASKYDSDVVGISSVTQNFNIAKEIAAKVKANSDALVLVGGHHITALPNNLTDDMDIAVLGEGEQTTLEIVQAYESKTLDKQRTRASKLIRPLDKIPFPARDLMRSDSNITLMFTSRGCPYKCVFCSSTFFWKSVRFFSASYVVDEICEIMQTIKPKRINFTDDLFIADKVRLRKIRHLIHAEGLHREVEFHSTARANLINNGVASLLKAMNVRTVSMGLESGSNRILQYLKGDSVTVEQNEKAIRILKRHGLNVSGSFIIGSPTETEKEIMQTYKFIERTNLDGGETYVLLPFPGTKVWDYGEEKGMLNDFMNWEDFEIYFEDNPNRVFLSDLSREELLGLLLKFKKLWKKRRRSTLFEQAFKHPTRILPFIKRKCHFYTKRVGYLA